MKNKNLSIELKSELNSIWKILTMAMQCYEFSSYLYSPSTESENDYANKSFFIDFTRHIYWRNLVIELSKLITDSNSQSFNVFKFLRKLKNNGYFGKLGFDNKKIENWENLLAENEKTINELIILRNKIYSHTDRDKENYSNSEITFTEIKLLIELLKNIIKSIFTDLLDTHAEIKPLRSVDKNFRVLKILANEKDKRIKKITNDFIENSNKKK
ncbi:MAG: hypothetical protein GZ086_10980 [Gelidibacter sp.]|nr:hypothetical protein [Gelidibacter sp.]